MNPLWGWKRILLAYKDNEWYRQRLREMDREVMLFTDFLAQEFYRYEQPFSSQSGRAAIIKLHRLEREMDAALFQAPSQRNR